MFRGGQQHSEDFLSFLWTPEHAQVSWTLASLCLCLRVNAFLPLFFSLSCAHSPSLHALSVFSGGDDTVCVQSRASLSRCCSPGRTGAHGWMYLLSKRYFHKRQPKCYRIILCQASVFLCVTRKHLIPPRWLHCS